MELSFITKVVPQKKECLKALIVDDNKFNVKECNLVGRVLKQK